MFFSSEKVQLKIYYFFMLADGECTEDEMKKFSAICDAMGVDEDVKREVVSFCDDAIHISSTDNSASVIRETVKLLNDNPRLSSDKCKQVEIIWTLINLGYADNEYTEAEKKVVSFLSDYWEVSESTFADLNDTAETILMLTYQKAWLKHTGMPYDDVSANIAEIDKAIARMGKNIELLISEANIA